MKKLRFGTRIFSISLATAIVVSACHCGEKSEPEVPSPSVAVYDTLPEEKTYAATSLEKKIACLQQLIDKNDSISYLSNISSTYKEWIQEYIKLQFAADPLVDLSHLQYFLEWGKFYPLDSVYSEFVPKEYGAMRFYEDVAETKMYFKSDITKTEFFTMLEYLSFYPIHVTYYTRFFDTAFCSSKQTYLLTDAARYIVDEESILSDESLDFAFLDAAMGGKENMQRIFRNYDSYWYESAGVFEALNAHQEMVREEANPIYTAATNPMSAGELYGMYQRLIVAFFQSNRAKTSEKLLPTIRMLREKLSVDCSHLDQEYEEGQTVREALLAKFDQMMVEYYPDLSNQDLFETKTLSFTH